MSAGSIIKPPADRPTTKAGLRYNTRQLSRVIARFTGNPTEQVGNPARLMRVQVKPVPPVAEYDAWLVSIRDKRGHTAVTGSKLRRCVHMIRTGSAQADCDRACGFSLGTTKRWLDRLPLELRP